MKQELKQNWILYVLVAFVIALIIFALTYMEIRQNQAEDRCHAKGGVTWDSGHHCILRDFTTIDTT